MAYYILHCDLKKDRRAVDLSNIDKFCKDVIRKDENRRKVRKQRERSND